jgi:hypothetical protein
MNRRSLWMKFLHNCQQWLSTEAKIRRQSLGISKNHLWAPKQIWVNFSLNKCFWNIVSNCWALWISKNNPWRIIILGYVRLRFGQYIRVADVELLTFGLVARSSKVSHHGFLGQELPSGKSQVTNWSVTGWVCLYFCRSFWADTKKLYSPKFDALAKHQCSINLSLRSADLNKAISYYVQDFVFYLLLRYVSSVFYWQRKTRNDNSILTVCLI